MYVIRSKNNPDHYFDCYRAIWTNIWEATFYKTDDRKNPTQCGEFVQIWEINAIQFARFIAEAEAAGLFGETEAWGCMRESMSMTDDKLCNIINRADEDWEFFKSKIANAAC